MGKSSDSMAAGATIRIAGTETYQKTAGKGNYPGFETIPAKKIIGKEAMTQRIISGINDAKFLQGKYGIRIETYGIRVWKKNPSNKPAYYGSSDKE
jgi:hypothetical protein